MAQRRHHYEAAFEDYLRARQIPYVAVDEARKALLPPGAVPTVRVAVDAPRGAADGSSTPEFGEPIALKCFDFVVYSESGNLLIDVKGRKVAHRARRGVTRAVPDAEDPPAFGGVGAIVSAPRSGLESWVTEDDIQSLTHWRRLFGEGFDAAFVFVYWCEDQPPDGLFQEVFEHRGRWYAVRVVKMDAYTAAMTRRSAKWRTVHVPARLFERISTPFVG